MLVVGGRKALCGQWWWVESGGKRAEDGGEGKCSREPDVDAADGLLDQRPDLEESQAEGVELGASELVGVLGCAGSDLIHEAVGGAVQEQPEEVGGEAGA